MTGNNSKKEHKQILEQMHRVPPTETMILVATGKLVGEGFDYPRLDTLFMAMPVPFRGVVEQYAGRLNRDYEGKKNVIVYDYVDSHIPMFDNMYAKRLKAYKQIGYDMKTVEEFCEYFVIIDQEIVWYGKMNLLGKPKIDDSMMRVHSKQIAAELMELTFGLKQD